MNRYEPKTIESKWQKVWDETKLYEVKEDKSKDKIYATPMLPYPSGAGLHVGHVRNYSIADAIVRYHRQRGYNVLSAIGWDAFGLPAENYAIKTGTPPSESTQANIKNFRVQLKRLGISYDWSREVDTSDPDYFKWTQWVFSQLFKNGLAYQADSLQWWCPKCKTVLANEQVENGRCWRHADTEVIKKQLKQWFFKITKYADDLLEGLDELDWPAGIKAMQTNWIGKSLGAELVFKLKDDEIHVFTTRPDTVFGATFLVLAPEHPLVAKIITSKQKKTVEGYVAQAEKKGDVERMDDDREKTGVDTGAKAVNPATGQEIPVWVADYVLMGYGTGSIMAVPAHDERDFEFAKKYGLDIKETVQAITFDEDNPPKEGKKNTTRDVVICVIKDKKGRFLTLKWNSQDWHNFVMGGVEKDEDMVEAAKREIAEETGYTDLKYTGRMPFALNSIFYAAHKDVNRDITVNVLGFELASSRKTKTKKDEHEDFQSVWMEQDKLTSLHPVGGLEYIVRWVNQGDYVYTGEGRIVDAGKYSGLKTEHMREKITDDLAKEKLAKAKVNYKIRDWLISRQRYWGAPIPIIHCPKCGPVAVPDKDLPVELPVVKKFEPTGKGKSVLADVKEWVNVKCPDCGGQAERETDTMDGYACSSWYLHRYTDAHNAKMAWDPDKLNYWFPLDFYFGGDHAVSHLLYTRFWNRFFVGQGLVKEEAEEPIKKLVFNGYINAPDGSKMSKSKGNVVDPLEIIDSGYGADALRLFELFIGPYDQDADWNPSGVPGTYRFLQRVWTLAGEYFEAFEAGQTDRLDNHEELVVRLEQAVHRTIKKVTEDLERLSFNTAVAAMMELVNSLNKLKDELPMSGDLQSWRQAIEALLQLLAPFAPHITEELWQELGHDKSIHVSAWPAWDEDIVASELMTIVVQVNGKVRANLELPADTAMAEIVEAAQNHPNVSAWLEGKKIQKTVKVPGRLVNFVVG